MEKKNPLKWKASTEKISDLKEYHKNPRYLNKHNADHLRISLNKFGQCEPVVINTDKTIIGGHQRIKTLKDLGESEVTVFIPERELNEKEIEELNIRLNKNTGDWDYEVLGNEWDFDDLLSWGFEEKELLGLSGFEEDEPSKLTEANKDAKPAIKITFKTMKDFQDGEIKIYEALSNLDVEYSVSGGEL